jgi:hypothetical protein
MHCKARKFAVCRRLRGEVSLITIFIDTTAMIHCIAADITPSGRVERRTVFVNGCGTPDEAMNKALAELGPFTQVESYAAFFGHVMLDKLYLLVATKVERAAALPFDRQIFNVRGTQWLAITLSGIPPPRATRKDRAHLEHFASTIFEEGYYYSDDANVSTLFPHTSQRTIASDDPCHCDWSFALRLPYKAADCESLCSTLVRGFVKSVVIPNGNTPTDLHMHMLGRQNRLNPGPRYFGRGLNELGHAGNDHVYELVLWTYVDPPKNSRIAFCRHVYLRGTVPLRFTSKLSTSGIGEATIIIGPEVGEGSDEYLIRQCDLLSQLHATPLNPGVSLQCVNLLKTESTAGEDLLTLHFRIVIQQANSRLKVRDPSIAGDTIKICCVDWLGLQKDLGTPGAVHTLWQQTLPFLTRGAFTVAAATKEHVSVSVPQTRFQRVNCADSLDRTNVAAFFICTQVVINMSRKLHEALAAAAGDSTGTDNCATGEAASLSISDDSETSESFATYDEMSNRMPASVLRALVELFVANGDCVAQLYTSTGALHTSVMRKLVPGMKEAPSNSILSAQRRYENMFRDKKKRRVLETMLGLRLATHFPCFQGMFGVQPLPDELWCRTVVMMGLDGTKVIHAETISVAIQAHWTEIQAREGVEFQTTRLTEEIPVSIGDDPLSPSSPLNASFSGTHHDGDESIWSAADDLETSSTQDDEVLPDGAEVATAEKSLVFQKMAVVVLPTPHIARELLIRGAVPVRYSDGTESYVSLHPYGYAVETRNLGSASPAGRVVAAASSLKRKLLRFVQ